MNLDSESSSSASLVSTFGWLFIASIISSLLFGISLIQFYNYCNVSWTTERWSLKGPIVFLMALDTIHLIVIIQPTYQYLVMDFGNFAALKINSSELASVALLTGFSIAIAQLLFVNRVYHLSSGSKFWVSVLGLLIAVEFAFIQVYYNTTAHARLFSDLATKSALTIEKTMNALILTTDLALASSLIVLLYRSRSGVRHSDTVVSRICTYVISTSAVTAMIQIMCLVASVKYPESLAYIAADLIASKCYINCMFVSLNARQSLRKRLTDMNINGISIALSTAVTTDTVASAELHYKEIP